MTRVPDHFTPLVGYRVWKRGMSGLLDGVVHSRPWIPGEAMVAHCTTMNTGHIEQGGQTAVRLKFHGTTFLEQPFDPAFSVTYVKKFRRLPPPVVHCSCGLYAHKLQSQLEYSLQELRLKSLWTTSRMVWGTVKLWGKIIVHTDGYRAEFAYPQELSCYDEKWAEDLRAMYRVPVHVVEEPQVEAPDPVVADDFFASANYAAINRQYSRATHLMPLLYPPAPEPPPMMQFCWVPTINEQEDLYFLHGEGPARILSGDDISKGLPSKLTDAQALKVYREVAYPLKWMGKV